VLLHWATLTNRFHPTFDCASCWLTQTESASSHLDRAYAKIALGQRLFLLFSDELAYWIASESNTRWISTVVSAETVPLQICADGIFLEAGKLPFTSLLAEQFAEISGMGVASRNWSDLYVGDTDWCSILTSMPSIACAVQNTRAAVFSDYVGQFDYEKESLATMMVIIPAACFTLSVLGVVLCSIRYWREIRHGLQALMAIETCSKEAASQAISSGFDPPLRIASFPRLGSNVGAIGIFVLVVVMLAALDTLIVIVFYEGSRTAMSIGQMERWNFRSGSMLPQAYEASIHLLSAWFWQGLGASPALIDHQIALTKKSLAQIAESSADMYAREKNDLSLLGVDVQIDKWLSGTDCPIPANVTDLHDLYNCSYLNSLYLMFADLCQFILHNMEKSSAALNTSETTHLTHLVMRHLAFHSQDFENHLIRLTEDYIDHFTDVLIMCMIFGLILIIALVFTLVAWRTSLRIGFDGLLLLVKRLPPQAIASHPALMSRLIVGESLAHETEMTAPQAIAVHADIGLLAFDGELVIQFLNPCISRIFGYSPERLLGQRLSLLFASSNRDEIIEQLDTCIRRRSNLGFTAECWCVNEQDVEIRCRVEFEQLDHYQSNSRFLLAIREVSQVSSDRHRAQAAKRANHELMSALVPAEVSDCLTAAGQTLSFSVTEASIILIEIAGLQEMACQVTPEQLLGQVQSVLSALHTQLRKCPKMTHIRVVGNVCMCASGLFSSDLDGSVQELFLFAFQCLEDVIDMNAKMITDIELRIGIATGGPIHAGVLGQEKLTFELLGRPIQMAARLLAQANLGSILMCPYTRQFLRATNCGLVERQRVTFGSHISVDAYSLTYAPVD
jgi:PAS domain S-box-containing protein